VTVALLTYVSAEVVQVFLRGMKNQQLHVVDHGIESATSDANRRTWGLLMLAWWSGGVFAFKQC